MNYSKGDLIQIEMKSGIYQVLDFYKSDDTGDLYIFRKVFDGKMNFKLSKADIVHDSWMSPISSKTREKLADTLSLPEVKATLDDLTIDKALKFGTDLRLEVSWCTMNPKNKKRLETLLNSHIQGFVNPFSLRNEIRELHDKGELKIIYGIEYPSEGNRMYRIELGRYFDDFDEFGNEQFRQMRFTEVKVYRREDLD
ncbi:MAG: hypothetical protein E7675_06985 [Ruminococcaceae bacterium]|nr:hypothetical protein [Oscillospiraceae bacterium]